jgi:hypothetical protein
MALIVGALAMISLWSLVQARRAGRQWVGDARDSDQ